MNPIPRALLRPARVLPAFTLAGLLVFSGGLARAGDPPAAPAAPAPGISLTVYSSADPSGFDPQQFVAQQRQGYNPYYARQVPGFAS